MTTRRASSAPDPFCTYILVTGANAGLGLAICLRLVDEFLVARPDSQSLHLVVTTRSAAKSAATLTALEAHVWASSARQRDADFRTTFQAVELDLTSLASVRAAAVTLRASLPRLDVLVCNAGIAGWTGVNWPRAMLATVLDFLESVTFPTYMLASVGLVTRPQVLEARDTPTGESQSASTKRGEDPSPPPPLGEVFTANVFGHYVLMHQLAPLLYPATKPAGLPRSARIVWVSSIEAHARCFELADPQSLRSPHAYESSKRLTDVLALSSTLPASRPFVSTLLPPPARSAATAATNDRPADPPAAAPAMYVTHPGVVSSNIMPLHPLLALLKVLSFYLARLLGSPWHVVTPYAGAQAMVFIALAAQSTLDGAEAAVGGRSKWGSAMDWRGRERLLTMEVEGWGAAGVVVDEEEGRERERMEGIAEEKKRERREVAWRRKGLATTTAEEREAFEVLGGQAWEYMEELRRDWEARMGWNDV